MLQPKPLHSSSHILQLQPPHNSSHIMLEQWRQLQLKPLHSSSHATVEQSNQLQLQCQLLHNSSHTMAERWRQLQSCYSITAAGGNSSHTMVQWQLEATPVMLGYDSSWSNSSHTIIPTADAQTQLQSCYATPLDPLVPLGHQERLADHLRRVVPRKALAGHVDVGPAEEAHRLMGLE